MELPVRVAAMLLDFALGQLHQQGTDLSGRGCVVRQPRLEHIAR
jgi:hypothetical protein